MRRSRFPGRNKHELLFDEFNQTYFASKLPKYRVEEVEDLWAVTWSRGHLNRKQKLIRLQVDTKRRMTEALLHEMVHAASNDYHGALWQQEMNRLHTAGAPVELEPEFNEPSPAAQDPRLKAVDDFLKRQKSKKKRPTRAASSAKAKSRK